MKNDFDGRQLKEVAEMTGLEGDMLLALTGTVVATVFIGKRPVKTDTAQYLGISKKYYDQLIKHATDLTNYYGRFEDWLMSYAPEKLKAENIIYPLATEFILDGFYPGKPEEHYHRALSRAFLSENFLPQAIQNKNQFIGFNIVLEYLWAKLSGSNEKLDSFARARFPSNDGSVCKFLQAFSDVVFEYNPEIVGEASNRPKYHKVVRALELAMRKGNWKDDIKNGYRLNSHNMPVEPLPERAIE
ncbi:hypothetical protein IJG78_02650 [Candidatus Saccharibacteria bacterium]|nr:hypothetical protein [Candidatus Saccharibacteria bacterium]